MDKSEILNDIFTQFDVSARQFCDETGGILCSIDKEYKGEDKPENLKYCFAKIYYNSFSVKFTYTAHGMLNVVNSILGCSVSVDKSEDSVEIPLPLFTDYCDINIPSPMFIPLISDKEDMQQAFKIIEKTFLLLMPQLENISYSEERKTEILNNYFDELTFIYDSNDLSPFSDHDFYNFFTLRFTTAPFINFIKGNTKKAWSQLKKEKRLTGYEVRMLDLWNSESAQAYPYEDRIKNADNYNSQGVQKANFFEFIVFFISWLILTVPCSAVFLSVYFLLVWIETIDSICLIGPIYNLPFCILFGFITAISISYFTRFKFYKFFRKKNYKKYFKMSCITDGGSADKFMKFFTAFISVAGIIGCLFLAKWNINFLSNGIIDNSKFLSLQGEFYSYDDVEKVYYKPDRINGFGDTIDYPSYVLKMNNGREIDLYELGDIVDYEQDLIELMQNKNIKIDTKYK